MSDPPDPPAKEALQQTADFVRLSSGLVTAVLGTSFVFFSSSSTPGATGTIYVAWVILLLSALASLVVYALIPPKFEDKAYTLHDPWLNFAGLAHLGLFVVGLVVLAIGVATAIPQSIAVTNAQVAADVVHTVMHAGDRIESIELIGGVGPGSPSTWHVRIALATSLARASSTSRLDVFLNATNGSCTFAASDMRLRSRRCAPVALPH